MNPSDKSEFLKIINGLQAIKPGTKLTADGLEMFWSAMAKWPLEEFRAAASHLAGAVEFMPNPFHFNQLRKAGEPTSGEAWATALAYCAHRRGPSPGGRTDRAAVAVGGYYNIGMANTETALPHIERRFKEAYEDLSDVEETRDALPEITLHELQGRLGGEPGARLTNRESVPKLKHLTNG